VVTTLVDNKEYGAGRYTVFYNSTSLSSGIYFYRFTTQSKEKTFVSVKKLVVVK
jgi:hypothetical protein